MLDVIELIKGKVYYRAVFYDTELSIPSIETYIYDGYDEEHGHLFINASGYVARQEGDQDPDIHFISFAPGTEMCILDKQRLIEWLQEEHSPRKPGIFYDYKTI